MQGCAGDASFDLSFGWRFGPKSQSVVCMGRTGTSVLSFIHTDDTRGTICSHKGSFHGAKQAVQLQERSPTARCKQQGECIFHTIILRHTPRKHQCEKGYGYRDFAMSIPSCHRRWTTPLLARVQVRPANRLLLDPVENILLLSCSHSLP